MNMIDSNLLKKLDNTPELSTQILLGILANYKNPRKKLHDLVKSGVLAKIKKGIYLVKADLGFRPYSKEIFANLIYGPSYISLESALSHYGFIPETVASTTSICLAKGKFFSTPIGDFEYCHVKESIYSQGVQILDIYKNASYQIATPEKTILDFLYIREKKGEFTSSINFFNYVVQSYRLDLKAIANVLDYNKFSSLSMLYTCKHINWFTKHLLAELKNE